MEEITKYDEFLDLFKDLSVEEKDRAKDKFILTLISVEASHESVDFATALSTLTKRTKDIIKSLDSVGIEITKARDIRICSNSLEEIERIISNLKYVNAVELARQNLDVLSVNDGGLEIVKRINACKRSGIKYINEEGLYESFIYNNAEWVKKAPEIQMKKQDSVHEADRIIKDFDNEHPDLVIDDKKIEDNLNAADSIIAQMNYNDEQIAKNSEPLKSIDETDLIENQTVTLPSEEEDFEKELDANVDAYLSGEKHWNKNIGHSEPLKNEDNSMNEDLAKIDVARNGLKQMREELSKKLDDLNYDDGISFEEYNIGGR